MRCFKDFMMMVHYILWTGKIVLTIILVIHMLMELHLRAQDGIWMKIQNGGWSMGKVFHMLMSGVMGKKTMMIILAVFGTGMIIGVKIIILDGPCYIMMILITSPLIGKFLMNIILVNIIMIITPMKVPVTYAEVRI